jgi:hypothetical protein
MYHLLNLLSSRLLLPFLALPNFARLGCRASRELMKGGVGPRGTDWACIETSLSTSLPEGLPMNLTLYIPLRIFASSNIYTVHSPSYIRVVEYLHD